MKHEAIISECGQYRYLLKRDLGGILNNGKTILFIMLNPSTADAKVDDPTIRRCVGFAKKWGYKTLYVGNLYGLRSSDPKVLLSNTDPVGERNDYYLEWMMEQSDTIVVAWGNNAKEDRIDDFLCLKPMDNCDLYCLGMTKNKQPKHPLYISKETKLIEWWGKIQGWANPAEETP